MCDLSGLIKEVCFPPLLKLFLVGYNFVYSFPPMVFSSSLDSVYLFISEIHLGNLTSFHYCVQENVLTPFFPFSVLFFCCQYIALLIWF